MPSQRRKVQQFVLCPSGPLASSSPSISPLSRSAAPSSNTSGTTTTRTNPSRASCGTCGSHSGPRSCSPTRSSTSWAGGVPVIRDDRPVRRWVWVVPIVFLVCSLVAIDYAELGDKTISYVLSCSSPPSSWAGARRACSEASASPRCAHTASPRPRSRLWSSVIFGAVHLTNALGHGAQAIPQALAVSFAGYFFYLTRRVSGSNVPNSILHGLFDFSLLTGTVIVIDQDPYIGSGAAILAYLAVGGILLVRRHQIEPAAAPANS